jgi:hypothetical protein
MSVAVRSVNNDRGKLLLPLVVYVFMHVEPDSSARHKGEQQSVVE